LVTKTGDTPEDLLKHADTALYGVKATGRKQYCLFEPQMQVGGQANACSWRLNCVGR